MKIGLVRKPDASIARCELTHLEREQIDFNLLLKQHDQYVSCLRKAGIKVEFLPELPLSGDGVFVEDTALVLDEVAVICHPGADSRKNETDSVQLALSKYRKVIKKINGAATVDGGDLLKINRKIYVGQSTRTNAAAHEQLKSFLSQYGYEVITVPVSKCLHLKTGVCFLGNNTVLLNPAWINPDTFKGMTIIEVDDSEPFGANAILLDDLIIHNSAFPLTQKRIKNEGFRVESLSITELAKAEAGLTCISLIFGE